MAYTQARLLQKDPPAPDGRVHIVVELTGDAGESPRRIEHYITETTTIPALRAWAWNEGVRDVQRKTVADQLTVGQTFTLVAPPAPSPPTATEIWLEKAHRLARAKMLGVPEGNAIAGAIATLEADVIATYRAEFGAAL